MPDRQKITQNKSLQIFGKFIHNPNLWHLNRYSVATAFSVGLFSAFIPIPFQMLLAASLAILFRSNLPISVALVWLTNPITLPPISYFCYRLGSKLLGSKIHPFHFSWSWDWLVGQVGLPFLVGSLVCAVLLAILGNVFIRLAWRCLVIRAHRRRQQRFQNQTQTPC